MPVERPQANGAQTSSGASASTFASAISGHDRVLGEGRGAHEVPQRLAVPGEARRSVRKEPDALLITDGDAAVRPRAAAMDAVAALRREQRDDVVAGRDQCHVRPDLLDERLARVRLRELDVLDDERPPELLEYGRSHPHRPILDAARRCHACARPGPRSVFPSLAQLMSPKRT
jgi:hypothetical protein